MIDPSTLAMQIAHKNPRTTVYTNELHLLGTAEYSFDFNFELDHFIEPIHAQGRAWGWMVCLSIEGPELEFRLWL